ncbi:hypothetical protein F5Y14DRAFT_422188 [Nemania sp. NC0429]|nr:hypothetical protein F5Y14DRAFT_422188 [Nemania sp. NC0429]
MPKQPRTKKTASLRQEVLTRNAPSRPTRTTSATSPAAGPANKALLAAEAAEAAALFRALTRGHRYYVNLEVFVATSEHPAKTRTDLEQFYKQFEIFTATRKRDCSGLSLESTVKPGTQNDRKWKLAKPCSLPPGYDEGNLRHRPEDYFEALHSLIDVSCMQEKAPVNERRQELIADLLDGSGYSCVREKGVQWCVRISPALPKLGSTLVAIAYGEIRPEPAMKEFVYAYYESFFGCTLSPDDIMGYPGVRNKNDEIDAGAIFRCLQENRSEHLKSFEIEGSKKGMYELCDQKQTTAFIVVWALVHYHDAELWPAWDKLGKAMVAQYPSKTYLEVAAFVHLLRSK